MKKRTCVFSKKQLALAIMLLLVMSMIIIQRENTVAQARVISIAEARNTFNSEQITIEGFITGSQTTNIAFMQALYASGPNDGIMVQIPNAGSFTGQHVRVTGHVRRDDTLPFSRVTGPGQHGVWSNATVTVVNRAIAQIEPIPITLEQANRGFEGMLVSLSHPIQIETRTPNYRPSFPRNHALVGTNTQLRAELSTPLTASINTVQDGSWVYVHRGHIHSYRGVNQIYASRFNESAYIAMTGIPNAGRITVTDAEAIAISSARFAEAGTRVIIEGVITGSQSANVGFMQSLNASGPHDGMMVQISNAGSLTGQHVRITGYVQTMQGHIRVNGVNSQTPTDVSLTIINSATATNIEPIPITLEQARTGYQGMLVSLIEPVAIERITGSGVQQHPLIGTDSVLRMNFDMPSGAFRNVQAGTFIYVNRAHIFYFTGGEHRIYSSSFNEQATIAMTGIRNANRITVQ